MLARRPSFSRQRKAPRLPPPPVIRAHAADHAPTYKASDSDEVKLCKALRGWLKKKHTSHKGFGQSK